MSLKAGSGDGRIFPRFSVREDVRRELEAHIAMRAEELAATGLDPEEAEREARRLLGEPGAIADECIEIVKSHQRAVRRAKTMDAVIQDLKYGLRTVLRSPGFAVVAILTLALGIGANAAIFSVVHGVLIEPLPFVDAEELVAVRETRRQGGTMQVAWANFQDWHEQNTVFDGLFAYSAGSTTILGGEAPTTGQVAATSVDLWSTLGATPALGRLTTASDHLLGAAPVVVVSDEFWRNELGALPLGELVLDLNGLSAAVVGVLSPEFDFPRGTSVWQPLELLGQSQSRTAHNWRVAGRLSEGVSVERANGEMDALTQRLVQSSSDQDSDFLASGALVRSLHEQIVGPTRAPLLMLLGAAGLVLLVACTNLASTLLARGANREREFAVRASLGAGQRRLIRQLLTESVVLAAAGATAGLGLATLLLGFLHRLGPESLPRLDEVGMDGNVLAYTAVVAMGTVLLFGLFPATRLAKQDSGTVLRSGSRGNAEGQRGKAWTLLVGSEVALALVLLVGSGLLMRSFASLLAEDTGFDAGDVMTTRVALSLIEYPDPEDHAAFYERTIDELVAAPGVSAAGVMSTVPMAGFFPNGRLELDGDVEKRAVGGYVVTSGGALEALDIPLIQGRLFDRRDAPDQAHVAIVSESFAREYWPNENPIGRSVTGGGMDNFWSERRFAEVVGVVGDVRYDALGEEPVPTVYFPYTQRPFRIRFGATVVVEAASGDAGSVSTGLRAALQRLDPDIPIDLRSQESLVGDSLAAQQFIMLLLGCFSLLALVLSVVGIYGVVSYTVARRTREMGVRLALGADPQGVVRLVMKSSLRMVGIGLVAGVLGSVLSGRLLERMLYEISPLDPLSIALGVAVLGTAATLASWIPARMGTRVDPMVTMRSE